jgi:hypothetical protein
MSVVLLSDWNGMYKWSDRKAAGCCSVKIPDT